MEIKDKFEVNIDKENHLLHADVTVYPRPERLGITYYDLNEVLKELNRQGYNLTHLDCVRPNKVVLRSDNGNADVYVGRWTFRLVRAVDKKSLASISPPEKKQPPQKTGDLVQPVVAKKTASTSKKTSKKTTSDVLKEYTKKQNN
tara:strand:+ start:6705 stop:7139 length:435 start_codon:yes stop_codon:yes gene_type:complete